MTIICVNGERKASALTGLEPEPGQSAVVQGITRLILRKRMTQQ